MRISLLDKNSRVVLSAEDGPLYTIPDGWQSIEVVTPLIDPANGLSSSPEAVDGILCVWGNLQGFDSVTVNANLSYTFMETVAEAGGSFDFYFIDPLTGDVGTTGTIRITGLGFAVKRLHDGLRLPLKDDLRISLRSSLRNTIH